MNNITMASPSPIRRPSQLNTHPQTPTSSAASVAPATPSSATATPTPTPIRRASANTAEQRRARREQLRNFYGLKDGVGGIPEGGDPLNIDSPGFDARMYYENLISQSGLEELMKTASSLSADIGKLHGDRHGLVYNHHHQLFAAGDTISHLNSRTPQLLSIMTNLQTSFSEISRLVDSVALPEESTSADRPLQTGWEKGMERFRLMVLAEESPEVVRTCFEGFTDELEVAVSKEVDGAKEALQECNKVIEGLPAPEVSRQ